MGKLRFAAKSIIHGAIDLSGRPRRQRQRARGKLIVLTYHSFCDGWQHGLVNSLPINRFERQIRFLRENFHLVSLGQGVENLKSELYDEKPWLAITIDDGFEDNHKHAWPLLRKYKVPATIFLATDFVDTGRPPWPTQLAEVLERTECIDMRLPFRASLKTLRERAEIAKLLKSMWCPLSPSARFEKLANLRKHLSVVEGASYPGLTWDKVREMRCSGIEFGSHTVYHSILPSISSSVLLQELNESKVRMETEIGEPCKHFAYPDGQYDLRTEKILVAAGYEVAVTQDVGINSADENMLAIKRIEMPYNDPFASFRARVSLAV